MEKNIFIYLSIKRILLKLVDTLELMGVTLDHREAILVSFEDLYLVQHFRFAPFKIAFPLDYNIGAPFPIYSKPRCLLLISICVNDQGKP